MIKQKKVSGESLFENAQKETMFNILNQQKLKKLRNMKAENKSN